MLCEVIEQGVYKLKPGVQGRRSLECSCVRTRYIKLFCIGYGNDLTSFNLDELISETVLFVEEGVWSITEYLWFLVCGFRSRPLG